MALVAKRNHIMTLKHSEQGQISIFFSASLVVFVSIIAFVINVGLFVKAKINLQNATDAAAWSGAAVQARQLTKIAYLNWEMRNIYKEWMYKYYVVGNLNVPGVEDNSKFNNCDSGKCTDFRLATSVNAITQEQSRDPYNIPATCIHIAGSQTNICRTYEVPGLPEFGGYNIPGAEEASRSFIDTLIGTKLNDCVERTRLNMLVNTTWAYNVLSSNMDETLSGRGPAILTDRQGAWPRAIELAMRIRNLEKVVNREAISEPVCIGAGGSCRAIDEFTSENRMGNERIIKAFFSGYRNLGNHIDNEMKNSFTLQELPPTLPPTENMYSASSLLIPDSKLYQKQYVDLKLMMVNLATFYAALIGNATPGSSAGCAISKVAIPIPGYPLGFYKNPDVLTYYAVKGEAEFEGMFNPFSEDSIKLTAYAAAKPAGGRIGPMLFTQKPSEQAIRARTDPGKFRSVPYLSSLNVVGTVTRATGPAGLADGEYVVGAPLPINLANPFWLKDASAPVGGLASGEDIQFGIPNLVYDYIGSDVSPNSYTPQNAQLFTITPSLSTAANPGGGDKPVGLFNHDQFQKFKGNISGEVSPELLVDQISRVKSATLYEAANYLVPTPADINAQLKVDSFGFIASAGQPTDNISTVRRYMVDIYAPLYKGTSGQQDLLFESSAEVLSNIVQFMRAQKPALDNYVRSLNRAANEIYKSGTQGSAAATGAIATYKTAAEGISDITDVTNGDATYLKDAFPQSCKSLSGQFWHFYFGDPDLFNNIADQAVCPTTLITLLRQYFAASANDPNYSPTHYKMEYNYNEENFAGQKERIFSAYMPGPFNGAGPDGQLTPPFSGQQAELMRRNFYSTKLVTLDSVQASGNYDEKRNFVIYSEGDLTTAAGLDRSQNSFANPLDAASEGIDLSAIKY